MKKIVAFIMTLCLMTCLFSCGGDGVKDYNVEKIDDYVVKESDEPTDHIRIVMKSGDAMLIELYPETAPLTVANFKSLVAEKYYDGITFHRVIADFMIQGGDPDGDGISNGDRPTIKGEFAANGVANELKHVRGVISMARLGNNYDSASTQFFIVHKTPSAYNSLDGNYAAFGMMLAGFDTLDKIATTKTDSSDKPVKDQTIAEIRFVNIVSR